MGKRFASVLFLVGCLRCKVAKGLVHMGGEKNRATIEFQIELESIPKVAGEMRRALRR
jgi:hypothetical protein